MVREEGGVMETAVPSDPAETHLRVNRTTPAFATGHMAHIQPRPCDHDVERATIHMRCVGWLDQKGRV